MLMLDPSLDLAGGSAGGIAARQPTGAFMPLAVKNLCYEIDGKALIDGIDFHLAAAGLTVVMGQNGAGKSLLLRLLHGLLAPTAGEIFWGGAPMTDPIRRHQAMVFQRPVLLRRSVAANIDFVLGLRGEASPSARDAMLDRVRLLDKANQPARLLSGGEQQRLALARALALKPKILFLDEPTASLDPGSMLMIEETVKAIDERGTKVMFVTHDLSQARRLADDILFLHEGRLEEQAQAERFFRDPASDVARAFLDGRIVL